MKQSERKKPRTKQQVVSEFRREEILNAARKVFARKGFVLGIMDEIAREAGIAKGTIYLYFRSKTEVYQALLAHDMKILQASTLQRIDAQPTLAGKMRAFILARIENAEQQKEIFRIMDSEGVNLTITRRQYRDFLGAPVLRLAEAIEVESRSGRIRQLDAERVAWLIADMTRGTIQRRLLGQSESTPAEEVEFLMDVLSHALVLEQIALGSVDVPPPEERQQTLGSLCTTRDFAV
ncbi:TetR/AcrR family transcriptional regulator [Telmatobacter bradus]|uniref:TetR/AcrR family transcriptional regulator n=1 Tax=Telmatobacter bradus TaxID=474953 RepID=UPI003B4381EA